MTPADWTDRDRERIEFGWRFWKLGENPGRRRSVVTSTALKCGDLMGDPDTWFASQWSEQIGRYATQPTPTKGPKHHADSSNPLVPTGTTQTARQPRTAAPRPRPRRGSRSPCFNTPSAPPLATRTRARSCPWRSCRACRSSRSRRGSRTSARSASPTRTTWRCGPPRYSA